MKNPTVAAYAAFVKHANFTKNKRDAKFLAALGLNGEAGEVSEIIKKHLLHGDDLDKDHLIEELGDVLWYFFHALNTFDISFEEVAELNIRKLCVRHPQSNGSAEDWLPEEEPETITEVSLLTGRTITKKKKPAGDIRSDLGLTADGHPVEGHRGPGSRIG